MAKKSITKNSIYYIIYNILNVLFPLLTGIYVARILLPANIGQIEASRNFAQYFIILSFLGIPTYGMREIAKSRNNKLDLDKIYSELMTINGISTTLFLVSYYSIILFVPFYRESLALYCIAGLSIFLNYFNNTWLFEGLEEFGYISIRNIVIKVVLFVLLIVFVRTKDHFIIYAFLSVIGMAGNYLLNIIRTRKVVHFSFKNVCLAKHLKPIFFLVAVNLAIEVYSLIDVTMLNFFCDDESVAFYTYALKTYKIFLQLINTFTVVLIPRLSLLKKENKTSSFNYLVSKTFKVILLFAIPLVIGIFFTANSAMILLYGEAYNRSSNVLKILSIILLVSPIGYLLGSRMLLINGQEKKMIIPVLIGAFVNVLLNIVLIRMFSETGAAFASVISECVVMFLYLALGRGKYKIVGIKTTIEKILIGSLIMTAFLITMNNFYLSTALDLLIKVIGAVFIYFACLIFMKEDVSIGYLLILKKKVFGKK